MERKAVISPAPAMKDSAAAPEKIQLAEADLRQAFSVIVREALSPAALGLGGLYTIFALSHLFVLPKAIAVPMSLAAAATAIVFFVIKFFLNRKLLLAQWAHPVGAIMFLLVLINSLLHLLMTAEPMQSTNLVLLVMGAGFLFLSTGWLAASLIATFGGWLAVARFVASGAAEWMHFGFALFTASIVAMLIQFARQRTMRRLEGLRFQNERRKAELETALAAAEQARQNAEISKRDFMQSEARLRMLTSQMPAILWTTDPELRLTSALGMGLETFALRAEQMLGQTLFEFLKTDSPEFAPIAMHYRALKGESVTQEIFLRDRLFDCKVEPLHDRAGALSGLIGIALDITDRKIAEEQLKSSLREKEALLKEIHGRVKNNLQVISSLLNLQSDYIQDTAARVRFKETQDRLKAMVLIHEKLYQSRDLTSIDFAGYIRNLAVHLFRSYQVNAHAIALHLEVAPLDLDIDRAMPCGLIINELVANALQHAFPNGACGEICLTLQEDAQRQITLQISDTGVGVPAQLDFHRAASLGWQLVNTLAEQIQGEIKLERHGGTKFTLTFRH